MTSGFAPLWRLQTRGDGISTDSDPFTLPFLQEATSKLENFGIEEEVREGGGSIERGATDKGGISTEKRGPTERRGIVQGRGMAVVPRWAKKNDTAGAL